MRTGRFNATAVNVDLGINEKTGNMYARVIFRVEDGDCAGEFVSKFLSFSDKAITKSLTTLRDMGWQGDEPGLITVEDLPEMMSITVERGEDFNGSPSYLVQWINRIGEYGPALQGSLNATQRSEFSEKYRVLASQIPKRPRAEPKQDPRNNPVDYHNQRRGVVAGAHNRRPQRSNIQPNEQREPGMDDDDKIPF